MDQILAIVWVRTRLLINTIRLKSSGWERMASVITMIAGTLLSLGIAVLIGAAIESSARVDNGEGAETLRVGLIGCFWCCTFFGVLIPLLLSTGASSIDTGRLRNFPISRRRLALISWGSSFLGPDHIFYYPFLVAAYVVCWIEIGLVGPGQTLFFLMVPVIIVTWSTGLVSLLQSILRHRRGKEIAGVLGISMVLAVSILPSMLASSLKARPPGSRAELGHPLHPLLEYINLTPPNLAADGFLALEDGNLQLAGLKLLALLCWLLTGVLVGYMIMQIGLDSGGTGSRTKTSGPADHEASGRDLTRLLPWLPPEVVAVISKELRYLLRSTVGKFNLLALPVLCVLFGQLFKFDQTEQLLPGFEHDQLVIYGLLMYALLFTNNFISNSAGWEGEGFKVYLLAPVSYSRVLLGKNIGVWLYASLLYLEVISFWTIFHGIPKLEVIFSTAMLFTGAMVIFTIAGNFSSIRFPIARDISAMKSQPSQAAILISILTVACLSGTVVFIVLAPYMIGLNIGHLIPLTLFALLSLGAYRISLPIAGEFMKTHGEQVLEKLESGH